MYKRGVKESQKYFNDISFEILTPIQEAKVHVLSATVVDTHKDLNEF